MGNQEVDEWEGGMNGGGGGRGGVHPVNLASVSWYRAHTKAFLNVYVVQDVALTCVCKGTLMDLHC